MSIREALLDYWKEWAGLLQWVARVSPDDRSAIFEAKALISGGALVRSFESRFQRVTFSEPIHPYSDCIGTLNTLAEIANSFWRRGMLSDQALEELAARAKETINSNSY